MTSTTWPETREVGGILSPLASENPYWYNANHVFVPYCSSDSWSGSRSKPESRDSFRFMGSLIVRQVMADLIPLGLGHPQGADLLMAGSSAGGLGVMLNIDKVRTFLQDEKGKNLNYIQNLTEINKKFIQVSTFTFVVSATPVGFWIENLSRPVQLQPQKLSDKAGNYGTEFYQKLVLLNRKNRGDATSVIGCTTH